MPALTTASDVLSIRLDALSLAQRMAFAVSCFERQDFAQAEQCCRSILEVEPTSFDALHLLAVIRLQLDKSEASLKESLAWLQAARDLLPDHADVHNNLGSTYQFLNQVQAALDSFAEAIRLRPHYVEAINNRGNLLKQIHHYEAALAEYDAAIRIKPDYPSPYYNRGVVLEALSQLDAALASYEAAIRFKPDYSLAHWNRSLLLLMRGRFEEGWPSYEWRWQTKEMQAHRRAYTQPRWSGQESLQNKTILVYSEQGLGDTIQFCRYVHLLAARGARVVLEVPKPLLRLLAPLQGVAQLVAQGASLPSFDWHIPLMSLPWAFKTTLDTIPSHRPYLTAEPERVQRWARYIGSQGFKIAICWQGKAGKVDQGRSFPLRLFEQIAAVQGVRLISLQKNQGVEQLANLPPGMKVEVLPETFDSGDDAFVDSAAIMQCVDLVITSDTALTHLAGALGVRTWLPLKHVPEWRWLLHRDDSPWYPQHRLFRQQQPDDWSDVFAAMTHEVIELVKHKGRSNMMSSSPNVVAHSKYGPIIVNINDRFIAKHIFKYGYWAEQDINLIKQLIEHRLKTQQQIMLYDVGANIGTHTLALAKTFAERITVRAFEAQSAVFNMLCGTVALNGLTNVNCHRNAVSDQDGLGIEIQLPDYTQENNFGGFELMAPRASDNQDMVKSGATEVVQSLTLDSFNERVDFIKMDIEGMEHLALAGAKKMVEASRPICFIEVFKTDAQVVFDFFKSRQYQIYRWGTADAIFIPKESGIQIQGLQSVD